MLTGLPVHRNRVWGFYCIWVSYDRHAYAVIFTRARVAGACPVVDSTIDRNMHLLQFPGPCFISSVVFQFRGVYMLFMAPEVVLQVGLKTRISNMVVSKRPPQKPQAEMSNLARIVTSACLTKIVEHGHDGACQSSILPNCSKWIWRYTILPYPSGSMKHFRSYVHYEVQSWIDPRRDWSFAHETRWDCTAREFPFLAVLLFMLIGQAISSSV